MTLCHQGRILSCPARTRHRAVAAIAALGLFVRPSRPIGLPAAQAAGRQAAAAAKRPRRRSRRPAGATRRRSRAAAARRVVDGGWPRVYDLPSGGSDPRLSAAGRELGQADAPRGLQRRLVCAQRRAEKPALGTIKLEADTKVARRRAPGELPEDEDRRSNFQTLPKEQVREITDRDRQGDSRRRAGDRARSRAREPRQEPDHPEEHRGREGRSADRSSSARRRR